MDSDEEVRMDDFRTFDENETVQGRVLEETNVDESQPDPGDGQHSWDELDYDRGDSPGGRTLRIVFGDVGLEPECLNPRFVEWHIRGKDLTVEGTLSDIGDIRLSYKGTSRDAILPYRALVVDAMSQDDRDLVLPEICGHNDDWRSARKGRLAKRIDHGGEILAGIIALAVGISLGLKRTGNDVPHGSRPRPEPGPRSRTPWTKIEDTARKAGGGILVWIGDHPFIVISGIVLYVGSRPV